MATRPVVTGSRPDTRRRMVDLPQPDGPTMATNSFLATVNERSRRRSEEHTSELQSQSNLVCRLLLEKKKKQSTAPRLPTTTLADNTDSPTTSLNSAV